MQEQEEQDFSSTASATEVTGAIVFRCDIEQVPVLKKFLVNKIGGQLIYQRFVPRQFHLRIVEEEH